MRDFYEAFYTALEHSQAYRLFCEYVYGKDMGQHGFADMEQLELLLQVTELRPGQHAFDLGCGDGRITEYLSDRSGAHFTGLDFIPRAIEQARQRTAAKDGRLDFITGEINSLDLPPAAYDLILSVDSIYFSTDYAATLSSLKAALKLDGLVAIYYSFGREPWVQTGKFPRECLPASKTPLAAALRTSGLDFQTWNLTAQDYAQALRRKAALEELKGLFELENTRFIYENRLGDSEGIRQAIEEGLHARYLYLARPSSVPERV
jgi:cyclopropane fatty-acyl-phospholipid synthase-like methyltransferase